MAHNDNSCNIPPTAPFQNTTNNTVPSISSVTVRRATLDELDTLMHWRMITIHEVFQDPSPTLMDNLAQANQVYYEHAIPEGIHIPCFAEIENTIVGCGGLCIQQEMPSPDNPTGICGYPMNIYALPHLRGHGIGGAITTWLIEQARLHNAGKIYLEASKKGRPLYEKLGFEDLNGYMKLVK